MASGLTNRGKKLLLEYAFGRVALPTNFYMVLCTSADTPTMDTNVMSELTQIATGNGYTDGGYQLTPGSTDFDTIDEDDDNDYAVIKIKDIIWTASGGPLPASGNGARWAVLTDDDATFADRQILAIFDLSADRTISDTQRLILSDFGLGLW
jgi:hypothetical protein